MFTVKVTSYNREEVDELHDLVTMALDPYVTRTKRRLFVRNASISIYVQTYVV